MDNKLIDVDLEGSLIGAALINPLVLNEIDWLDPDDFGVVKYRDVWRTMVALKLSGEAVDVVTVSAREGNPGELAVLISRTPSSLGAESYARAIQELAKRRRLSHFAPRLLGMVRNPDIDISDIHAEIGDQMAALDRGNSRGVVGIDEMASQMFDEFGESSDIVGRVSLPWPSLNWTIGNMSPGELVMVLGRPSMGKTQFILQILDHVSEKIGPVLLHALEDRAKGVTKRIALSRSRVDGMRLRRGVLNNDEKDAILGELTNLMGRKNLMIYDDRVPVRDFRMVAKGAHRTSGGLKLVAVDYLQRYPLDGKNEVRELGEVASTLKDIARELEVPVLAAVQLSRSAEHRDDKRPTMSDARGSGIIEQDADIMLALYRESYYVVGGDGSGQTEIIVLKSRDGARNVGAKLYWNAKELRFMEGSPT